MSYPMGMLGFGGRRFGTETEEVVQCTCSAKHTSFPQLHSDYCDREKVRAAHAAKAKLLQVPYKRMKLSAFFALAPGSKFRVDWLDARVSGNARFEVLSVITNNGREVFSSGGHYFEIYAQGRMYSVDSDLISSDRGIAHVYEV